MTPLGTCDAIERFLRENFEKVRLKFGGTGFAKATLPTTDSHKRHSR
jgi:hypothetical protein